MNLEEFYVLAEECGYSFSCNNVSQGDIDTSIAFVYSTLGIDDCTCISSCCCTEKDINCAIVYHVWCSLELSIESNSREVEEKTYNLLRSKGCLSFGY